MQNIKVTRYQHPRATGWAGYIEPSDGSWIAFIGLDGRPRFFLNRCSETGAILPDDPDERTKHLAVLRGGSEPGLRIGMAEDGRDGRSPLEVGERVFPLGEDGGGGDVIPIERG